MGWKKVTTRYDFEYGQPPRWRDPNRGLTEQAGTGCNYVSDLPDPLTDANDTEAVMHHLKERGYMVSIDFWAGEVSIAHENATPGMIWEGCDWKTGVCELASRLIGGRDDN
jgi:hypothetical protein